MDRCRRGPLPIHNRPMITLKSNGNGLVITLGDGPWSKVLAELAAELERARGVELFRGRRAHIETGERALTPLQVEELAWALELHGIKFEWGRNGTQAHLPGLEHTRQPVETLMQNVAVWDDAAWYPRALHSGQTIRYASHVVVLGDVDPGAEIVALGNVMVWGELRGLVHAGAAGNAAAVVCALEIASPQLRIGNFIAHSPDDAAWAQPGPKIARIENGRIEIQTWNPKA